MPTAHLLTRAVGALLALGLCGAPSQAGFLVRYDFSGAAGDQAFQAPDATANGITAASLTRGPGITAVAGANSMNSSGWDTSSFLRTNSTDYYQFSITVEAGYEVTITSLSFNYQRSSTGPKSLAIKHSLTNFSTGASAPGISTTLFSTTNTTQIEINYPLFTSFPELQNVTGTLTFRIYGYRSGDATGAFRLGVDTDNNPFGYAPELVLNGEVTSPNPTPAPPGLVLLASGGLCFGLTRLRRVFGR